VYVERRAYLVSAQRLDEIGLLARASGNDICAGELERLDEHDTDAGAAAVDEDSMACLNARRLKHLKRGLAVAAEPGRLREGETGRRRSHARRDSVHQNVLRHRAAAANHLVDGDVAKNARAGRRDICRYSWAGGSYLSTEIYLRTKKEVSFQFRSRIDSRMRTRQVDRDGQRRV
jgi:hypothetical protein